MSKGLFCTIFCTMLLFDSVILAIVKDTPNNVSDPVINNTTNITGCECLKYDCKCCVSLLKEGNLCLDISYLDRDYGLEVVLSYNNIVIINETVSARNPPPICVGEEIVQSLQIDVCLRFTNLFVKDKKLHFCAEVEGRIGKVIHTEIINLGCASLGELELSKDMKKLSHNVFQEILEEYKKLRGVPVVKMV